MVIKLRAVVIKGQFHGKMTVGTWIVFKILLLNVVVLTRKETKNVTLQPHTLAFTCLPRGFWALIIAFLAIKALKEND